MQSEDLLHLLSIWIAL